MVTSWRSAPVVGKGVNWSEENGMALTTIAGATYDLGQPRFSIVVPSREADNIEKLVRRLEEALAHSERLLRSARHRELGAQAQRSGRQARIATRPSIALSMLLQLGGDV